MTLWCLQTILFCFCIIFSFFSRSQLDLLEVHLPSWKRGVPFHSFWFCLWLQPVPAFKDQNTFPCFELIRTFNSGDKVVQTPFYLLPLSVVTPSLDDRSFLRNRAKVVLKPHRKGHWKVLGCSSVPSLSHSFSSACTALRPGVTGWLGPRLQKPSSQSHIPNGPLSSEEAYPERASVMRHWAQQQYV